MLEMKMENVCYCFIPRVQFPRQCCMSIGFLYPTRPISKRTIIVEEVAGLGTFDYCRTLFWKVFSRFIYIGEWKCIVTSEVSTILCSRALLFSPTLVGETEVLVKEKDALKMGSSVEASLPKNIKQTLSKHLLCTCSQSEIVVRFPEKKES